MNELITEAIHSMLVAQGIFQALEHMTIEDQDRENIRDILDSIDQILEKTQEIGL